MIEHHTQAMNALARRDLWARLEPLDRYGLADFASVLVDRVPALAKLLAIVALKAFTKPNA
jgi:hypothetical protein